MPKKHLFFILYLFLLSYKINAQLLFERPAYDFSWPINRRLMDVSNINYLQEEVRSIGLYRAAKSSLYYEDTGVTYSTNGVAIFSSADTIPGSDSLSYHPSQLDRFSTYAGPGPDLALMLPGFHPDSFSLFSMVIERIWVDGVPTSAGIIPHLFQTKLVRTPEPPYAAVVERLQTVFSDTLDQGLSAVRHGNGRDWWIVLNSRNREEQHILLYDPEGVHHVHTLLIEDKGDTTTLGMGQSLFSPDGNFYAKAKYDWPDTTLSQHIYIHAFDRCSGIMTPYISYQPPGPPPPLPSPLGLAFSPNGRFIYHSDGLYIYQYDLEAADLTASRSQIFDFYTQPEPHPGQDPNLSSYFKLAPTGEIIAGMGGSAPHFHRIINTNQKTDSTDYLFRGLPLEFNSRGYFPNTPPYGVGPLDGSPCDTLGISHPTPLANFEYVVDDSSLHVIFYDSSSIYTQSWAWDFGDGTNTDIRHPQHTYNQAGIYQVCLTATAHSGSDNRCKMIYVGIEDTTSNLTHEQLDHPPLKIFPNPANTSVYIQQPQHFGPGQLYLFDMLGKLQHQQVFQQQQSVITLSLETIATGIYTVIIENQSGIKRQGRLVVY